jgi:colanic acid biosynthesis glycosyl transferase WcaI
MADIHLLPQSEGAADLVLPSKLSGMLASGRPVLAACRSGTELESVVNKCGIVVQPQDAAGMAAAVCKLVDEPVLRAELGRCGRSYAEANLERDAVLGRVFAHLDTDLQNVADDVIA